MHRDEQQQVCCQTDVSMLAIEREDFVNIFMANVEAREPDFITFLRQIPEVRRICSLFPSICLF